MSELLINLTIIAPELILALVAMALLMIGSFFQKNSINIIISLSFFTLIALSISELFAYSGVQFAFNLFFIEDNLSRLSKFLIFFSASVSVLMASNWLRSYDKTAFEFPILIMFSTLGMALMVSANDLITLYLAIELQSLPLYVLATFNRNDVYSSESGVKYFILGALSSGLLLYGSSLIYGFSGTTIFTEISQSTYNSNELGLIIGLVFLISGVIFKISVVPFHMWVPDVYEGVATPVTAFFASVPKMAAIVMLVRLLYVPFDSYILSWSQIIIFVSLCSIALGSIVAIWQTNIKRLIAYSSIAHMGFAILALSTGKPSDVSSILIYMIIYVVSNIGFFACLINIQNKSDRSVENITDLSGLSVKNPALAISIAVYMFSFAGIPPLAGFFAKYFIFMEIIEEGLISLAVFGLIASVIGAFYYIRFVKVMFFDNSEESIKYSFSGSLRLINLVCVMFIIAFIAIISITPLVEIVTNASLALN